MAVVHLLLLHGADPNARVSVSPDGSDERYADCTALHLAAETNLEDLELSEALLQRGAMVDARTAEDITPLQLAASCSFSITHLLVEAGASPLLRAHDGRCALDELAYCTRKINCHTLRGAIERTDVPPACCTRYNQDCWWFLAHEIEIAPLIAATLIKRCYAMQEFEEAHARGAADTAERLRGADAPVTRMPLRLAQARVPLAWRRNNACAFPQSFRAVVQTLLLCRARRDAAAAGAAEPREEGFQLDDACLDTVVAHLARLVVWPTLPVRVVPWEEEFGTRKEVRTEQVSVFDFAPYD
jgi:hypothetical protein